MRMEVYKFLPEVRGGAQRAEGSVVEGKLLYYCLIKNSLIPVICWFYFFCQRDYTDETVALRSEIKNLSNPCNLLILLFLST